MSTTPPINPYPSVGGSPRTFGGPDPLDGGGVDVEVKAIVSETAAPVTVTMPEDGLLRYPLAVPIENGYEPFGSEKEIGLTPELRSVPSSVTFQPAPEGNPV
jgi:hypothetical protein